MHVCVRNLIELAFKYCLITAMDMQFSSALFGNLTTNFEPARSSLSFRGRKRQTTLMLSSAGISRSADISMQFRHPHTFVQYLVAIVVVVAANVFFQPSRFSLEQMRRNVSTSTLTFSAINRCN